MLSESGRQMKKPSGTAHDVALEILALYSAQVRQTSPT